MNFVLRGRAIVNEHIIQSAPSSQLSMSKADSWMIGCNIKSNKRYISSEFGADQFYFGSICCVRLNVKMDDKIYGVLRKSKLGEFMYYCSECEEMYQSGFELEQHILLAHEPEPKPEPEDSKEEFDFANLQNVAQPKRVVCEVIKELSPKNEADDSDVDKSMDFDSDDFGSGGNDSDDDDNDGNDGDDDNEDDDDNIQRKIEIVQLDDSNTPLECTVCGAKYKNRKSWEKHMELRHCRKKTLCTVCGEECLDIEFHMRSHRNEDAKMKKERRYTCKVCNAIFRHSSYLNIHMRVHTGEAPYMCSVCGRMFISQGKLTHHMKRHSDVKQHQCDQCDRSYYERFQLKKHINIVHKGIRLFSCTLCTTNKFTTKKSLGQHMLLHGEKRYQCKFCDQKFAQGSGRRGHEKRVHGAI